MALARPHLAIAGLLLTSLVVAGCSSDSAPAVADGDASCPITVADPWVKASDGEMTPAFGVLTNQGDTEMAVVTVSSKSAGMMEIHEVIDQDGSLVMQPLTGGLIVPAGQSVTLAPEETHFMLMDLPGRIDPGETVQIMLTCADGGAVSYGAVAKPFDGAEEEYEPAPDSADSMDHSATAEPEPSAETAN